MNSYIDRNRLQLIADGAFQGLHNVTYLYELISICSPDVVI